MLTSGYQQSPGYGGMPKGEQARHLHDGVVALVIVKWILALKRLEIQEIKHLQKVCTLLKG